jgi:hypothetical protein
MTHDELISLLTTMTNDDAIFMKDALRAVVELHKPMLWKNLGNDTDGYKCQVCEGNFYPCPTIQAIEKELV